MLDIPLNCEGTTNMDFNDICEQAKGYICDGKLKLYFNLFRMLQPQNPRWDNRKCNFVIC